MIPMARTGVANLGCNCVTAVKNTPSMPAGVRKIPTAMASPATAPAADPNPSSRRRPPPGELDFATDSVIDMMNL